MTTHTEREIASQPDVWRTTLSEVDPLSATNWWREAEPASVIVTGCGSTFYLALTAASLIRDEIGVHARATPASELALGNRTPPGISESLLIAISRSGSTSETVAAVRRFRALGGRHVLVVTNHEDSPLALSADVVIAATAGQEQSVAQTRSFSSMLLSVQMLVGTMAGHDLDALEPLPELGADLLGMAQEPMGKLATDLALRRFAFLASDPLFGVASEGMLKLKEMSLTDSESFHTLEYRHGPISMADDSAAIIGLVSDDRTDVEMSVLKNAESFGARTISVGANADIPLRDSLPSWVRPALMLLPLQVLALERARSKNLNPDSPRNLVAVIKLDGLGSEKAEHYEETI